MSNTGDFINYNNEGSTANPNLNYPPPSTTVQLPMITVGEVLARQSFAGGWICPDCKHHKGNLHCDKNMFISFVGCYTKDCQGFEEKK